MHVSGLKLFVKNFGWLVGLCFFLLVVLFPPLPLGVLYSAGFSSGGQSSLFLYAGTWGGILWHVRDYFQWQAYAHNPSSGRTLFENFAPYCFVPATLPICTVIAWQWLVSRAKQPTKLVVRSLLAVVAAFVGSLILVYLLDEVGGRLLLSALSISGRGNLEVRDLISGVWLTSIAQSFWFLLPCLGIGALLAWWQENLWRKHITVTPMVP